MTTIKNRYRIQQEAYSEQLRRYMIKVFASMFIALAITGFTSASLFSTSLVDYLIPSNGDFTSIGWIAILAPLVFVLIFATQIHKLSSGTALTLLFIYSALIGVSFVPTFYVYTGESIVRVFFITSATFLAMSIYGYTTRRNLLTYGSFLLMGVIGVLIASLVNIFYQSSSLYFVISMITVLVFVGFTACDVQRLKKVFDSAGMYDRDKVSVVGALTLYMDFLNIFVGLLYLLGKKKNK